MQLQFRTISEPSKAGRKWKKLFDTYWPGYKSWFTSNKTDLTPDLETAQEALKKYMPNMWSTYLHLCELTQADDEIALFLTGFQPPAYISACAQAVINTDEIQLVRNYDYHPNILEGAFLLSKWNNKKVIGSSDCLIGLVDGMNDDGLCMSLTFGGRKEVGYGFGIPFILRYVLEFCSKTTEAVKVLKSIPSHMSYNVTIVDKKGVIKTVMLAPDRKPKSCNTAFATNHQGKVDWPENALFNQTVKRYNFIDKYLKSKNICSEELAKAFLHPPLYHTKFSKGFGTLYTAVYQPENLRMKVLWPNKAMEKSFDFFKEEKVTIKYVEKEPVHSVESISKALTVYGWQDAVVDSVLNSIAYKETKEKQDELREKLMPNKEIAWDVLVDYWDNPASN